MFGGILVKAMTSLMRFFYSELDALWRFGHDQSGL